LSPHLENPRRGTLVPIGGAEEKVRDAAILKGFVDLCGGEGARIAVIPTASSLPDTGDQYVALFESMSARASSLAFDTRADCDNDDALATIDRADGVFMTGGNQLRLSTTLGGTAVSKLLRRRFADGLHVAGTSAGAAFLSEHMIAYGDEGSTPRSDMVALAPGLGLLDGVIIDQHFRQRDRLGRLLTSLAYNPCVIGIGLDEDTAAFLGPDEKLVVRGSGAITIVDPTNMEYSSMDSARRHEPVNIVGVRLHVLVEGGTFDLRTKEARPPQTPGA